MHKIILLPSTRVIGVSTDWYVSHVTVLCEKWNNYVVIQWHSGIVYLYFEFLI